MMKESIDIEATIQQPDAAVATQEKPSESQRPREPVTSDKTPQEFYAEITRRADVRAILQELAEA